MRKIIHIDMDAFFASVEQRDNPSLRGRPVAVGHDGPRGVVATASYEARPYGVRSAMPISRARRLCPDLIVVPPRFEVYKEVSGLIRKIFSEYTELVEPLSLDEAFLDVSHLPSATIAAMEIKRKILSATGLTASAGVSVNKMVAKIASDFRKPDGLFVVEPRHVEGFVSTLGVERFFGIGKVTTEKMHRIGIFTGADLASHSERELVGLFGKAGHDYFLYARGVDNRPLQPHRERKSVGAETTFEKDTDDGEELRSYLSDVRSDMMRRLHRAGFKGKTVTLKLKFDDFRQITRSRTIAGYADDELVVTEVSEALLSEVDLDGHKVRLIGLAVSNASSSHATAEAVPDMDADICEGVQLLLDFPGLQVWEKSRNFAN